MKFEVPSLHRNILVESVCENVATMMGYVGKVYYCLSNNDPDIFDTLKMKILETKQVIDRIKYSEVVVIETEGKWVVIKNRFGATTTSKSEITVFPVGYVHPVRTTKAFIFEVLVIDHDGYGIENAKINLSNAKYVNPTILSSKTADIGKWDDDHPLNYSGVSKETILGYFNDEKNIKKD